MAKFWNKIKEWVGLNTIKYVASAEIGFLIIDIQDQGWDWKPYVILVLVQTVRILNNERAGKEDVAP